jgi:hypothetical protein
LNTPLPPGVVVNRSICGPEGPPRPVPSEVCSSMKAAYLLGASLAVALLAGSPAAADDLKSGPQKPSIKIVAFNPLHCTGASEGEKRCLV